MIYLRGRLRATLFGALLAAAAVGSVAPAQADPLVCVSLSYYAFGTEHPVLTNFCQVPTWWSTGAGDGPICVIEPPPDFDVCYSVSVALP